MKYTEMTAAMVMLALAVSCQPAKPETPAGQRPQDTPAPTGQPGQGGFAGGPGGAGGGQRTGGRNQVIPVQVATAVSGSLMASNTSAGAVSPETQSSVAAGASGTVRAILRKAGDWVKEGDVVIQLDDSQLKLSLQLAQTALQNATVTAGFDASGKPSPTSQITLQIQNAQADVAAKQKILAADKELFKIGGVTQATLDNDQTAIQTAQATLEGLKASVDKSTLAIQTAALQVQQAQLNLANAAIKAPFDGQISAVNLHPGEYVGASTAAFVLVSGHKILTFSVPPSDAPGLSARTPLKFTYGGRDYTATITQLPAAPVGGLIPLTASLPDNLSPPLGTVGTITYSVELARGTLVPLPSVQSAENTTFVFTVNKANKVAKATVTILAETGAMAAVLGVPVGSTVILNPPPGILVGSTVQPQTDEGVAAAPGKAGAGGPQPPASADKPAFDPSKLTPEERAKFQERRKAAAAEGEATPPVPAAPEGAPEAKADRPAFDPSKMTPEQRAKFQERRKAAEAAAPPTGGQ